MTGLTFTWEGHALPFSRTGNGEDSYKLRMVVCVHGGDVGLEEDESAPGQLP